MTDDLAATRGAHDAGPDLAQLSNDRAPDGLAWIDAEGRLHYVNDALCRVLGRPRGELLRCAVFEVVPGLGPERWRALWQELESGASQTSETEVRGAQGSPVPVEVTCTLAGSGGGQRLIAFVRELSARRAAESRLRESEARFRSLVEQSPLATQIVAPDGRTLSVNRAWERLWGVPFEALRGYNLLEDRQLQALGILAFVRRAFAGEPVVIPVSEYDRAETPEVSGVTGKVHLRTILYPVHTEDGALREVVVLHEDLTEQLRAVEGQQRLRAQLQATQRMESIGRLAGGLAHDFNNVLSVILGRASMVAQELGHQHHAQEDLREILDAVQRSAELTRQLLAFARRQTALPVELDLNESVGATLKLLRRLLGEDIRLDWAPAVEPLRVELDPSQLDQILTNLCVNARDAIAGVGTVRIATDRTRWTADDCAGAPDTVPGDYAVLQVSDDGCGMDDDVLTHIFEPFFTTKVTGHSTGLGLATVYGIVKQNRGHVTATSRPGAGTTFQIVLPLRAAVTAAVAPRAALPAGGGSEVVLVVEDEEAVMRVTRRGLERLGYRVLSASSPSEAVRLMQAQPTGVALLLTDVVMPEQSGWDLSRELLALAPGLRVLFMSGYMPDVVARQGVLQPDVDFIQKPFGPDELAQKVRAILDRPSPRGSAPVDGERA